MKANSAVNDVGDLLRRMIMASRSLQIKGKKAPAVRRGDELPARSLNWKIFFGVEFKSFCFFDNRLSKKQDNLPPYNPLTPFVKGESTL